MSSDLKDLFQHIRRYTPQTIELDTKLRPFIPEYIPAVGDIDAFLKVRGKGSCLRQCVALTLGKGQSQVQNPIQSRM